MNPAPSNPPPRAPVAAATDRRPVSSSPALRGIHSAIGAATSVNIATTRNAWLKSIGCGVACPAIAIEISSDTAPAEMPIVAASCWQVTYRLVAELMRARGTSP